MKTTFIPLATAAALLFATDALADTSGRGSLKSRTDVSTLRAGRAPAAVPLNPNGPDKAYPSTIRRGGPSLRENDPTLPYWAQEWDPSPRRF
jgi:hypothetical protein